jgi:hypothetical protein
MEIKDILIMAEEFHKDPGARQIIDGKNSGEIFYEKLLLPRFKKAKEGKYILKIDLDGVFGYPSSFISESFGVLSKKYGSVEVLKYISFKSERRPIRKDKIEHVIKNPDSQE